MPPLELDEVAQLLADRFAAVEGVGLALPYEPKMVRRPPMVSVRFAGFIRAGLENPDLSGTQIRDPIGGRAWVYEYVTRLWVPLGNDEEAAQVKVQRLTKAIVLALEADRSLGSVADDCAIARGLAGTFRPKSGGSLLMVPMPTQVELTEPA